MLNTYINATNKILHWLTMSTLGGLQPIISFLAMIMTLGGLLMALFNLPLGDSFSAPFYKNTHVTHGDLFLLGCAITVISMAVSLGIALITDKMYIDFFFPVEEEENARSFAKKLADWTGLLILLAGFIAASHYIFPKLVFGWPFAGVAMWFATGIILGILRGFFRHGSRASKATGTLLKRAAARASLRIIKREEKEDPAKVLQFKRRG